MEFINRLQLFNSQTKIKLFMSHVEANTFLHKQHLMMFMVGVGMMKDSLESDS